MSRFQFGRAAIHNWEIVERRRLNIMRAVAEHPGADLREIRKVDNDSSINAGVLGRMVEQGELLEEDGRYWPALSAQQVDMKAQKFDELRGVVQALGIDPHQSTATADKALDLIKQLRTLPGMQVTVETAADEEQRPVIVLAFMSSAWSAPFNTISVARKKGAVFLDVLTRRRP